MRAWLYVLGAAALVAVVSLASNVTTTAQLSGDSNMVLALRRTVSVVANSGTVWGGLLVLAGWLVRTPRAAVSAGVVAGEAALVIHYGLGQAVGMFGSDVWSSNVSWFICAPIAAVPLGLLGAAGRRTDLFGLCARLAIPGAALLEPLVLGLFSPPDFVPWPERASDVAAGVVLILAGLFGAALMMRGGRLGWTRA